MSYKILYLMYLLNNESKQKWNIGYKLHQKETACFDVSNKLRINKNVNLSPLEYTLKGYDHISDLLLANY